MGSRSKHGYLEPENDLPTPKFPRPMKKFSSDLFKFAFVKAK